MRKACAALAVGAIVSMPRPARADSPPLELTWKAPAGCPDTAYVRRRIDQILRGLPHAKTHVAARGSVEATGDGRFDLALTVRNGEAEESRTITAASCSPLADAFAVVVALAIDPSRHADAAEAPPEHEHEHEHEHEQEHAALPEVPSAPPPPLDRRPKKERLPLGPVASAPPPRRFAFGLGSAIAYGLLPDVNAGVVASVVLRIDRFRFGALGTLSLRQKPSFDRRAGATFDMIEAGVFGGYVVPLGSIAIGPCVGVEATHVRVRGFGIRDPQSSTTVWPTAAVGGRLEARVSSWLGVFARADLLIPFGAPSFTLPTSRGAVALHDPALVAPQLGFGLEIVLP